MCGSGAPRFFTAAKQAGVKALVGAEISLDTPEDNGPAVEMATRAGLKPVFAVLLSLLRRCGECCEELHRHDIHVDT